ncbi:long-chain fatty acid--CoA ligase [Hydrogenophaga crassostreae]|uniref:Long-chain fatty acid--CoA ligase n=1 Tax=Hydrogenophaga crassostreae TaxID=1763535 RepID=A0A167GEQ2_9BURK|nr:long-chain-fatty-acid--CoA ligase [Hydrogenophaga crassostreae]AOW11511.1 long-chain fatty acid--CoA ligase [Hydrogenophaga crassostreae]OAD39350.1 long-chain fatty acid--CoA ligase [Hydrogenophaga crassostreae]
MLQNGLMMDRPLLLSDVIEHAAQQFGRAEVVSRETHGALFRYTYAECAVRARKLANALAGLGLKPGSAVGSIAWNNHRHLEAYYGVSGSGMVMHTCNPRLHPQQLIYIINHAEDEVVLFDATFAPLVKGIAAHCPKVRTWVCLADAGHTPDIEGVANVLAYETLIEPCSDAFEWPSFDERTGAALCYTSGTTGNPKGALYSHRSIVLNALSGCLPGVLALAPSQTILPVVPMFHINAWCVPYAAPIAGAKLVLPGPMLDGKSLYELMESEAVTISAGVPTIWQALLGHVEQNKLKFTTMRCTAVGGSAMPQALIARFMDEYNVEVRHGWGMTETTAVATMGTLSPESAAWTPAQRHALIAKQGKSVFGVEIKIVDENGATLPRDGSAQGELMVRGQWILASYFKGERSPLVDGWFPTGDIATIDADGVMQIRDRTKDVIKTGGEWISSIDLESAAVGHPAVAMAAVIGVKHPKWDERPLLFIVRKPGQSLEKEEMLAFLAERVAKWWVPDDVVFLESLPVGGTGKVQKADLRKDYGGVFS